MNNCLSVGILFVIKIVQLFLARNYDNTEKFVLIADLSSYWVFEKQSPITSCYF